MTVIELREPGPAEVQRGVYNAGAGELVYRQSFAAPSGIAWAIVGTFLHSSVTPEDVEPKDPADGTSLEEQIEALSSVTVVKGDKVWGTQVSVEDPSDIAALTVTATASVPMTAGSPAKTFDVSARSHRQVQTGSDDQWCVWLLIVPAELNRPSIDALESDIESVTGVTRCHHLLDGMISDRADSDGTMIVETRTRIETPQQPEQT